MAKKKQEKIKILSYDEWFNSLYKVKKKNRDGSEEITNLKTNKTLKYNKHELKDLYANLKTKYKYYLEETEESNSKIKGKNFARKANTTQSASRKEAVNRKKEKELEERNKIKQEKDAEKRYAKFKNKKHKIKEHTFIGEQFSSLNRRDLNKFIKEMANKANEIIKNISSEEEVIPEMQYKIDELKRMGKTKEKIGTGWMLRKEKAVSYAKDLERFVYGSFSTEEKRENYRNRMSKAYKTFTESREDFADMSEEDYAQLSQWFEAASNEAGMDLSSESVTTIYDYASSNNVNVDPAEVYRRAKKKALEAGVTPTQDLFQVELYNVINEMKK